MTRSLATTITLLIAAATFVGFVGGREFERAHAMSGSAVEHGPGAIPPSSRRVRPSGPTLSSQPAAGSAPRSEPPEGPPPVGASIPASVAASGFGASLEVEKQEVFGDCAPTAATWLARMAVGEVDSVLATELITEDHAGIAQTVPNVAAGRGRGISEALRALAPRLHGDKPQSRRQAWVAGLPACGDEAPPTWVDCRDTGGEHCDGNWLLYKGGWAAVREWARTAVANPTRACYGDPIAYGCTDCGPGGTCCDDWRALERGLCRLDCGERIAFWARDGEGCSVDDELTAWARERAEAWCAEKAGRCE